MKLLPCPGLGLRPLSEFICGGEVRTPPAQADAAQWGGYVFNRSGAPGVVREWWYHRPSGQWLVLARNTLTNEVVTQVPLAEVVYVP